MRAWTLLLLAPGALCAAPCTTAPLTSYLTASFSCNIGDKTFGDFAAALSAITALGTATPAAFSDITVTPVGGSTDPGFSFGASFRASTASLISASSVTFTVAYTGTSPVDEFFTSSSLFLTNPAVSGLGVITAAEALCLNGSFTSPLNPGLCPGVGINTSLLSNITNANLGATVTFDTGPVNTLGVIKQITLTSGLGGSASADALNNGLAATVPEASSWILAAIPLLLIGRLRFRRRE